MKKEFKQTRIIVKKILEENPHTRDSDMALYVKVIEMLNRNALDKPIMDVLQNLEFYGLPCFETVRRTRQKLQSENPNLKACGIVQDFRTEREEEFRKEFGYERNY